MAINHALSADEKRLYARCETLVGQLPALAHLSLVVDGELQFKVDPGDAAGPRAGVVAEAVINTFLELHDALQVARTGALIRLVVHTPKGAVLAYTIPRRGHLVGFCLTGDADQSAEADRALSALATRARAEATLDAQNPGGWVTVDRAADVHPPEARPVVTGAGDERVLEICEANVDEVLQYVLHFGADGRVFAVDHFDCVDLTDGDGSATPSRRRRVYRSLADDLEPDLRDLRRQIYPVLGRSASAAVLDVEEGAVIMRWLPDDRRLFGVTVIQDYVNDAEQRFAGLAETLASLG